MNRPAPERLQQLLDAAATCFARRGFHRTTMDEIAREAGVSAGLIYRHFAGKEELIVAIVEQHRDTELARVAAARQAPTLVVALDHLLVPAPANTDLRGEGLVFAEVLAEALRNPRVEAVVRAGDDAVRDAIAELIAAAQERGEITPAVSSPLAAELLCALSDGMLLRSAFASPEEQAQLQTVQDSVRQLCARMLGLA